MPLIVDEEERALEVSEPEVRAPATASATATAIARAKP
jgi:hypothetical protein